MTDEIESLFGSLMESITTSTSGNELFVFSEQNVPIPPAKQTTNTLYIKRMSSGYNGYFLADQLWVYAHKQTYRYLALLTLSALFHPEVDQVHLQITHPWSDIKHLIVRFIHPRLTMKQSGYYTRPYVFNYYPKLMGTYPWLLEDITPKDLPCFFLTTVRESVMEGERQQRDTIIGFGTDTGSIRFAELLLNMSLPQDTADEYVLEGEGGYRGVGIHSAEVRMFLPGHLAWDDRAW